MRQKLTIRNERGQTMTEFAFVLPVLLVVVLGIVQFGIVFNNYVTLTDAVRAGARKAAVSRNQSNPAGVCKAAVIAAADNLDISSGVLNVTCTPSNSWQPGSDVVVHADYPYDINLLGFVVKSGRLNSTTTERVE